MEARIHQPVLVSDILKIFPEDWQGESFLDCTFGRGGHSTALAQKYPKLQILGLDRDQEAIDYGVALQKSISNKIEFLNINFHDFCEQYPERLFDAILIDLGVSSPQLDQAERGFSFDKNGPLDMRMDQKQILTAADVVNGYSKTQLVNLFIEYGEIKNPYAVVDSIFEQRRKQKFTTTRQLVEVILKHSSKRWSRHPATLYFLAIRMLVNQELEGLEKSLPFFINQLKSKAYLFVITFHSLEDRIVKNIFKDLVAQEKGFLWNKKVIRAARQEQIQNPRSRSAKLRVFVKT